VLGHLEVVAADGFDRAVAPGGVHQLDPHGLPAAGKLAEGERERTGEVTVAGRMQYGYRFGIVA
jgi:hypothetical protein